MPVSFVHLKYCKILMLYNILNAVYYIIAVKMILPEIAAVGIYNSDIAVKNMKISKNRKISMFEIELPVASGGVSYIDSDSISINLGMIICAKPRQIRHTRFPFKCYYVHMILHSGILYDTLINSPSFFATDKFDTYQGIFKKILTHYNMFTPRDEIMLQSYILELVYTIGEDTAKSAGISKSANNHIAMTDKVLGYIKDNLTENLSLETVAKTVHLSPIHFHNSFKAAVGKALRCYVEEQRLKKAINLLLFFGFMNLFL